MIYCSIGREEKIHFITICVLLILLILLLLLWQRWERERERLCVVALGPSRRGRMLWCSPPRLIYMTLRDTCQHNSPRLTSRHNSTEFLTDIDGCSVQSDKAKMFVSERFSSGQPRLKTERPHLSSAHILIENIISPVITWQTRRPGESAKCCSVKSPNLSLSQ